MWYSGKPRLWKENNSPYIPTCNLVGIVFEFLPYGKKSIEVLDIVPIKQCS